MCGKTRAEIKHQGFFGQNTH